jgi:hypothetical protein
MLQSNYAKKSGFLASKVVVLTLEIFRTGSIKIKLGVNLRSLPSIHL